MKNLSKISRKPEAFLQFLFTILTGDMQRNVEFIMKFAVLQLPNNVIACVTAIGFKAVLIRFVDGVVAGSKFLLHHDPILQHRNIYNLMTSY